MMKNGHAAPGASGLVTAVPAADADLVRLRASIDNIDAALVHLLAERFKCTQQVGVLKARTGLPPADPAREAEQVARLRSLADQSGLDPEFAEKFLAFLVAEVIQHHTRLRREADEPARSTGPMKGGGRA